MTEQFDHRLRDGGTTPLLIQGAGTPLLMVHGWTLDHRSFEPQQALASQARLIRYDRRGFGRCTSGADLEQEPADIIALLDQLELDSVVLLGVSQGGRVALRTACAYPGRFCGLILQGAPLDDFDAQESDEERIPLAMYRDWARAGRLDELRAHWLQHPLMQAGLQTAAQRALVSRVVSDYDARDLLASQGSTSDWQVQQRLPGLDFPIMTITGELDTASRRRTAEKICALAKHGAEARIAGGGHLCNLSHPDEYNAVIAEWLERL